MWFVISRFYVVRIMVIDTDKNRKCNNVHQDAGNGHFQNCILCYVRVLCTPSPEAILEF